MYKGAGLWTGMGPGEIAGIVVGVWAATCLCVYVWKVRKDAREMRERGGL